MELIPGVSFDFGGGRTYIIPPLSLGALRRLQGSLAELSNASALAPATLDTVVHATLAGLKRNYPYITEDEVAELIDVGNMHDVVACLLDVTGLKRKAQEAERDAAKNQPAQTVAETPAPTGLP